ncbi:MAG: hypothetical protein D6772_00445 [Bacteroidetes bacterium]|nr:MAG: hypothetical protein D6772_00445 [Bacteroidota bacterium]
MYRVFALLPSGLLLSLALSAQSYDLAAGVRLGTDLGLSVKLRLPPLDENFTLEAILQTSLEREEGLFSLLAAQHFPLITRRLNLYAGAGFHLGWLENDPDRLPEVVAPAGISLIGGAELNFKRINISTDFKPAINVRGGEKRFYSQTAVTLRYQMFDRYDIWESPREKRRRQRQNRREERRRERQKNGGFNWRVWEKG